MNDLISRLREAASQMKRGVYGPQQVSVMLEAAEKLELINGYIEKIREEAKGRHGADV